MIRIIAGKYKGRKLKQVPDKYVRPTQAIIRKSIMQILEPFSNMKILDLYAGVGTLGIEAISRGASHLTAVERNHIVVNVLKNNVEMICNEDDVCIVEKDVNFFLSNESNKYDVIFADPPYKSTDFMMLKNKISKLLTKNGVFCMEMKKTNIVEGNIRIKLFGNKQVVFWRL